MAKKNKTKHPRGYGAAYYKKGNWYARWRQDGLEYLRPATTESEAEELLDYVWVIRRHEKLTLEVALERLDKKNESALPELPEAAATLGGPPFSEILALYLDDSDRFAEDNPNDDDALRESTRRSNRERSGILKAAPWSSLPLEGIHRKAVRQWRTARMASGVSGKSAVNDLTLASSVWNFADERGLLDDDADNPFLKARPKRFARKERQALAPAELLALRDAVKHATPDFYPLFLGALFSGWRAGELGGLREEDLDLGHEDGPRMTIPAEREKTRKTKIAYLGEPLVSLLREERRNRPRLPSALVFTTRDGRRWTPWLRLNRLRAALATVSLEIIPPLKRDGDRKCIGLDFHSLRHCVSSLLNKRGHREVVVGELLGQSDAETRKGYTHPYPEEAVAIAADVAAFLAPPQEAASGE